MVVLDLFAAGEQADGIKVGKHIHDLPEQSGFGRHKGLHRPHHARHDPDHERTVNHRPKQEWKGEPHVRLCHEQHDADHIDRPKGHGVERLKNHRRCVVAHQYQPRCRASGEVFLEPANRLPCEMRVGTVAKQARAVAIKADIIHRMAQELDERAQHNQHQHGEDQTARMVPPDRRRGAVDQHINQPPRITDKPNLNAGGQCCHQQAE